jgi:DNA modification methylase
VKPWLDVDGVSVYHGDCIEVMRQLPDNSVDAVVTDPPYGLGFMGKDWDSVGALASRPASAEKHDNAYPRTGKGKAAVTFDGNGFQLWFTEVATEALRILKPGGHLLAFGGTRTWHRLAVAIEDAGFEVRDSMAWMYGSGFPKSLDVSKAIDKRAGAEREVVGKSNRCIGPSQMGDNGIGTFKESNWAESNNITAPATPAAEQWQGWGTALKPAHEPIVVARKPLIGTVAENVLTHGTGALNIDGCRIAGEVPSVPQPVFGVASGVTDFGAGTGRNGSMSQATGRWPANVILDESQAAELDKQSGVLSSGAHRKDYEFDEGSTQTQTSFVQGMAGKTRSYRVEASTGGASRFFYVAKANKKERPNVDGIAHPTVKPMALMRYLVRLVTPPGGTVLEPFAGSGTTIEACVIEGFNCIAIEREADYLPLIEARLSRPIQGAM